MPQRDVFIRWRSIALLLLLAALGFLRFAALGTPELTNAEAAHALDAASRTLAASPFWAPAEEVVPRSPMYHVLTDLIFQWLGATTATARLAPALASFTLAAVMAILGWRERRWTPFVMGALYALSPVLVTTGRTAGGAAFAGGGLMLAVAFGLMAEAAEQPRRWYRAGAVSLGVALASGPSAWHGLFPLAAALGILRFWKPEIYEGSGAAAAVRGVWREGWAALVTMLIAASGVGTSLPALDGLAESLTTWLRGWVQPDETSFLAFWVMLLRYEPLLLILAVVGLLQSRREKTPLVLSAFLWAGVSLGLLTFYRGRQPQDLIWVVLPLGYPAARGVLSGLSRLRAREDWLEFGGLSALTLVLVMTFGLAWVSFAAGFGPLVGSLNPALSAGIFLFLILGGLGLLLLFGLGWSWSVVADAVGLVAVAVALLLSISAMFRLSFNASAATTSELWRAEASGKGYAKLADTLRMASMAENGMEAGIAVQLKSAPEASLAWALRDEQRAPSEFDIETGAPPVILVRETEGAYSLLADYVGQSLALTERRNWFGLLPPDMFRWWVTGEAPSVMERWIVLVRSDIASLGESAPAPEAVP